MRGLFFRADSTFPKDTYSPACSFTRSFLRSENRKWRIGMLCLTEQQMFLWRNSSLLDDSELTHPQSANNHLDELPRHLQYKTSAALPRPPRSCHFLPPLHSQSIPWQHSVHQSKSPLVGVARPDWCIHLMMKERGRLKVRNVKWTREPSIAVVVCTCVCVYVCVCLTLRPVSQFYFRANERSSNSSCTVIRNCKHTQAQVWTCRHRNAVILTCRKMCVH